MKRDKFLQHQLARLNRLWEKKDPDVFWLGNAHFTNYGTQEWVSRFCDIYHRAICRSLTRFVNSL